MNEALQKAREARIAQRAAAPGGKISLKVTHTVRMRDGTTKALTYGRNMAIKLLCTECLGFEGDPKDCTCPLCPVYPFRGRTLASQGSKARERATDALQGE